MKAEYSDRKVARAKALLRISSVKCVANLVGAPYDVVRAWRRGLTRADVQPDFEFLTMIRRMAREP